MAGRLRWKWRLTKRLYECGFDGRQIVGLYAFLDWVLNLPEELALQYESRLTAYEEERHVKYVTSIERHGIEKGLRAGIAQGIEQGIEKGIEQGSAEIVLRLLERRFGTLEATVKSSVRALPLRDIEALTDAFLGFPPPNFSAGIAEGNLGIPIRRRNIHAECASLLRLITGAGPQGLAGNSDCA
jgi:hypothetical protein